MDAFDSVFARRLQTRITEALKQVSDNVCGGGLADHAEYKRQTAYIQAYTDMLGWMREVEHEINTGK